MSTDAVIPGKRLLLRRPGFFKGLISDIRSARIIRYAVGITLAVALAYTIEWPLAFLTPILTGVILGLPLPIPPLKAGLSNMFRTLMAFMIGALFTLFLLPYPLVYIPVLGLVLFHLYYYLNRGGSFWFVLMSLLAILILPMLGNTHEGLAFGFAMGFILSGWLTVIMVWVAHTLIPDPSTGQALPAAVGFRSGYSAPAAQAALKSTIVVLPLATLFITFNLTDLLVVMVFAAIFSLTPDVAKGKQAGIDSLKSTLIGGFTAWAFYWLIVAVPELYFFLALMFLVTLSFGGMIFSGKPSAKYYGSAFAAMFVLVNSNLGADSDFTSAFLLRIAFILLATVYLVFALKVLHSYWPRLGG